MSPPDPENDPIHKGLHELGRRIDEAEFGPGGTGTPEAAESGEPPRSSASDVPGVPEDSGGSGESDLEGAHDAAAAENPVEKGLHELGRQIDEATVADAGGRSVRNKRGGPAHAVPKGRRRRRKVLWIGGTLALVIVVLVAGVAGYGWYLNHKIHRIDLRNLTSSPVRGEDAGTENILMIGSTDRCALTVQNPAFGICSQGVNGVNSDVVMILHLNPTNHSVSILSIPRDLFVPNARKEGANKIDAALYEGPDQLIAAIEEDYGIPIQHFVELNFDTFMNVVNALGGIKMYFPEPVYDAYSGLNIEQTGCLSLNGTQALQVVRARHLQYKAPGVTSTNPAHWPQETQSDLARIRRDHEFLRVLASAVKAKGLSDPITDQQLVAGVVGQLTVDGGWSATDMIGLVIGYHNVNVNSAPQLTIPVAVDQFGGYVYKGGSYGDIEFPAEPQDHAAIDQFLGLSSPTEDTYTGGQLPAPSGITVSVLNGSGAYNQATDTAQSLRALGFGIGTIGDTAAVGAEAETVVYYGSKTAANLAAAQRVADSLSGAVIMADDPSKITFGSQITVVTGTDFSVDQPPPPVTATTTLPGVSAASSGATPANKAAAASGTTTTTTLAPAASGGNASGSSAFQPPTADVESLAPWDPRSCTPSGGEGT